ncbi:MAG: ATP phosphoribosyltransferase regulatory subunit [Oscillospiraceae bacterium]|jgi:ATP phosphoribosyltransferase regulatory subunit|nr:ATP phosphoribosyltransferase regulatory subunit [Oscillospiraceae bacterium]
MTIFKAASPEGTRDKLFAECLRLRGIRSSLMELFSSRSYKEIMTPELEYYDLFVRAENPLPQETMFKLVDRSGRLLVMRPDCTAPIARLVASHFKDAEGPFRLCYDETVFRSAAGLDGADSELPQCGVELIGAPGLRGDIEIVSLAVDAVRSAGLRDFRLELGHADFFFGLTEELGLSREDEEALRACIESRSFALLDELVAGYSGEAAQCLRRLPYLFGGPEILDEAAALTSNPRALAAVERLRDIWRELVSAGRGDCISFDLGLVQGLDYYTGVIFRCWTPGAPSSVLAGGRYDRLLCDFGLELAGAGFAVYVGALASCFECPEPEAAKTLIFYESGCLAEAVALLGGGAELSCFATEAESLEYARRAGMKLLVVSKNGIKEVDPNV